MRDCSEQRKSTSTIRDSLEVKVECPRDDETLCFIFAFWSFFFFVALVILGMRSKKGHTRAKITIFLMPSLISFSHYSKSAASPANPAAPKPAAAVRTAKLPDEVALPLALALAPEADALAVDDTVPLEVVLVLFLDSLAELTKLAQVSGAGETDISQTSFGRAILQTESLTARRAQQDNAALTKELLGVWVG